MSDVLSRDEEKRKGKLDEPNGWSDARVVCSRSKEFEVNGFREVDLQTLEVSAAACLFTRKEQRNA